MPKNNRKMHKIYFLKKERGDVENTTFGNVKIIQINLNVD